MAVADLWTCIISALVGQDGLQQSTTSVKHSAPLTRLIIMLSFQQLLAVEKFLFWESVTNILLVSFLTEIHKVQL